MKKNYDEFTSALACYMSTWENKGAYYGYVVHRHDLKRLTYIHDTPWEQAPMIRGWLTIYDKTKDRKYLDKAILCADLQLSRFNKEKSYFNYAGFEDDRFSSLVHNALADCALLNIASYSDVDQQFKDKIIETVKDNIQNYFVGRLWNSKTKACKFNDFDYYSPNRDRFVANMNSIAVEAMIEYYHVTGDHCFLETAKQIGSWIKTQVCNTDDIRNGAICYSDVACDVYVNIYTALALRGINALYQLTLDEDYKRISINAVNHLISYSDGKVFYHSLTKQGELKEPYFIAGAGMILIAIDDANRLFNLKIDTSSFVTYILSCQQKNGGIDAFHKYNYPANTRVKARYKGNVWEDCACVPAWNAQLFEFLSRYVSSQFQLSSNTKCSIKIGFIYLYIEGRKRMFVLSLFPLKSATLLWINKSRSKSRISWSLLNTYSRLVKYIRKDHK